MAWVEVNGAALRYEVSGGTGKGLVLVHEMGRTLESWDRVIPELPAGRRILRFDTRGAGLSEKLRGTARMADFSADILGLLEHAGIAGPVAVAGCAVGGAVAIHFAARYPERTSGLFAMAPAVGIAAAQRAQTLARIEAIERDGMRATFEGDLDRTFPAPLRTDPAFVAAWQAAQYTSDPSSFAAINRMIADLDMTADLARVRCPTLVLAGRHDPGRPPDVVRPVAEAIPGAVFEVLETGHFTPSQTPELIGRRIARFLAETGS
jgi:pimeloyl-ACP methyl ester carboxylesterase